MPYTLKLLQTKLYRPAVPVKYVRRSRISRQLQSGLDAGRQLSLISAPAGFGKTTCANEWLGNMALPATWLSLEAADDDPGRFFTYLVAALQKIDSKIGSEIYGVLRAGQLPPREIISTALINDILAYDRRFLLVLDDFQVIQDPFILEALQTLINNWPQPLHLLLLTREEPSLPLARLRANNRMTEIRAADLRFSYQETAVFLNDVLGLSLRAVDVATLEAKTEGWVVGLQLAGLSIRDRANPSAFIAELSGSHRHILSYLTEEVLNQQPTEIQRFLLQTAVLNKLNGALCDAVTGGENSHNLLEQLFEENLFLIPLDDQQRWYRYHQLFADLLRGRLNGLPGADPAALHRRASRWYAQEGYSEEAIQHAIAAADFETAVMLIESHAMDLLMAWHAKTVRGWMQAIPVEWTEKSPKTILAFAWMHLLSNNFTEALPYINQLENIFSGSQLWDGDPAAKAEWMALQATLLSAQGMLDESLALANQALEIVPAADDYVRSLIYSGLAGTYKQMNDYPRSRDAYQRLIEHGRLAGSFISELMGITGLGLYAMERGELHFAFELAAEGIERVERSGTLPPISAAVYGELGGIYFHWYQIEKAYPNFKRAAEVSTLSGYSDAEIYFQVIKSQAANIEEDLDTAAEEIKKAAALMQVDAPAAVREEVIAQKVHIALRQNQLPEAEAVLNPYGFYFHDGLAMPELDSYQGINHSTGMLYISALRVILYRYLALGNLDNLREGIMMADQQLAKTLENHFLPQAMVILLIRAQMFMALGDDPAAQVDVAAAVELAQPEGFITVFLNEGEMAGRLLLRLIHGNQLPTAQANHVRTILAAFPENIHSATIAKPALDLLEKRLIEPLSKRELEILRLIGEGYTNQEIAERLLITLHTVKKHSSNIYSKLGVRSRTQAVARARELQLL